MTDGDLATRLAPLIAAVKPGQRIRSAGLAVTARRGGHADTGGGIDAFLSRVTATPGELARLVSSDPTLGRLAFVCADGRVVRRRFHDTERHHAYLDCNNLAWSAAAPPRGAPPVFDAALVVTALRQVVARLRDLGVQRVTGVADPSFARILPDCEDRYGVADACEAFIDAPATTSADEIICGSLENDPGLVVSNDRMREWRRASPWMRRNLWRLLVPVRFTPQPDYCDAESELRSIVPSGRS